jgi:hypothetical protein
MNRLDRLANNIVQYLDTGLIDSDFVSLEESISFACFCIAHQTKKKYPEVSDQNQNEVLDFAKSLALEYAKDYLQDIA